MILQKHVEHYSNLYDNAPMPYMQRLTWGGVALHAGNLPGYPASHGCIRLPKDFARLLYQVTHRGMTVVITKQPSVPRFAPAEGLLAGNESLPRTAMHWNPARSPSGPVSIVVSASDKRAVVLRNGSVIGSAIVDIDGPIERTTAYLLNGIADDGKRSWARISLPGQSNEDVTVLRGRIRATEPFRALVEPVLTIATTVIVTNDSLGNGRTGQALTVLEND